MQESINDEGFTYLHAVLNILSAAECYDHGELLVDGLLCSSCATSLQQLERLQNQVRDLVDFLVTGYQQRARFSDVAQADEEGEKINGRVRRQQKHASRKTSLEHISETAGNGVSDTRCSPDSTAALFSSDDESYCEPPPVECETSLIFPSIVSMRGRGGRVGRPRGRGPGRPRGTGRGRGSGAQRGAGRGRGLKPRQDEAKRKQVGCEYCGERFVTVPSLRRHLEEEHGEVQLPKVQSCGFGFLLHPCCGSASLSWNPDHVFHIDSDLDLSFHVMMSMVL
jgi:hypothetical protein